MQPLRDIILERLEGIDHEILSSYFIISALLIEESALVLNSIDHKLLPSEWWLLGPATGYVRCLDPCLL